MTTDDSPKNARRHRIDVHHHIVPPDYVSALKAQGITETTGGPFPNWLPSKSIRFMNRLGIDKAVVHISTPGVTFRDREFSRDLARLCNEYMAGMVKDYPGRFVALAALPMFDVRDAIGELTHAIDVLGLSGAGLLSNYQGVYLGDPSLDPLFAELDRRRLAVHVHPTDPPCDIDTLKLAHPLVEWPFDTTRAVANMVFNGTIDRFPNVKIILSHGGGTTPFLAWKIALQQYSQTHKKLRARSIYDFLVTKRGPEAGIDVLERLYYDTALAASPYALRSLQELVDTSHILFGTDYCWAQPWMAPLFTKALRGYDGFSREDLANVERNNALALFPELAG